MMYRLVVPAPDAEVLEVRVLEWHRRAGEAFARGDLLVELETAKAVVEVRAGQAGVMRRTYRDDGDWQKTGETLAIVTDAADDPVSDEPADELLTDFEVT